MPRTNNWKWTWACHWWDTIDLADVSSLQNEDGSFSGDDWGEVDTRWNPLAISLCLKTLLGLDDSSQWTEFSPQMLVIMGLKLASCRFSYCALGICALLNQSHKIDVENAAKYVLRCKNFDGGFGVTPGNLVRIIFLELYEIDHHRALEIASAHNLLCHNFKRNSVYETDVKKYHTLYTMC